VVTLSLVMNRRHIRVGRSTVIALGMAVLPVVLPTTAAADPISDQKALVAQVTDQLEALENQADALAENYATAMGEKADLDARVAAAQQQVAAQQAAVDALRSQLSQVAVQAYMGAGTDGTSPMFNSSSDVTDQLARDQLSRVAMSAGAATTDQYDEAVKSLKQQQAALDEARAQAQAKAEQIETDKKANAEQQATYTKARADAEAKLGDLIKQEEERRARESFERMQAAAAAAKAKAEAEANAAAQAQQRTAATNGNGGGTSSNGVSKSVAAIAAPAASRAPVPQASSRAGTAVNAAMSQVGVPYVGYQATPGGGFDCSGLTMWAWGQAGVGLPHNSAAQYGSLPHLSPDQAQPGDLLFYHSPISHVAMYLGGGSQIHAPSTGDVVKVVGVNWGNVVGVARPG
jgi:cell wall-associated NlpC family hydrolase